MPKVRPHTLCVSPTLQNLSINLPTTVVEFYFVNVTVPYRSVTYSKGNRQATRFSSSFEATSSLPFRQLGLKLGYQSLCAHKTPASSTQLRRSVSNWGLIEKPIAPCRQSVLRVSQCHKYSSNYFSKTHSGMDLCVLTRHIWRPHLVFVIIHLYLFTSASNSKAPLTKGRKTFL